MYPRQVKRKKPTPETAHRFYKEGSYSIGPEHHLNHKQRGEELERVLSTLREAVPQYFPARTQNLEYAVLKTHLIIEYALTQYIRCFSRVLVDDDGIHLSFAHKLDVAYLMGFGAHDPVLLPTVQLINKVRNQVAHTFALDRTALDEALRINSDDYDSFSISSDRERIRHLRWIAIHICGRVGGEALANYALSSAGDD